MTLYLVLGFQGVDNANGSHHARTPKSLARLHPLMDYLSQWLIVPRLIGQLLKKSPPLLVNSNGVAMSTDLCFCCSVRPNYKVFSSEPA